MVPNVGVDFEALIFNYIDEVKFLFFPDQWSSAFLDYSKNEILVFLFLYRKKSANMTEISNYINAPLNTTTGIVGRLEKKQMLERKRDDEDRRIVNIVLTGKAQEFIDKEKKAIEYCFSEVCKVLNNDEKVAAVNIFAKVISVLKQAENRLKNDDTAVKKVKRIIVE